MSEINYRFPTWCPGCGNFGIWSALKNSITKMGWGEDAIAVVFGVGCSGNMADFVKCYGFHALHGRAVPVAVGIKTANHKLPVLVVAGDGDCYGEGGNHLIHASRGNHDINIIVHDNKIYSLTTGQVAPTARKGFKSKSTPGGVIEVNVNALALAISQGATFVAQAFAGDIPKLTEILVAGFKHKGISLINILQPCVTFNKEFSYDYYRKNSYYLDNTFNNRDKKNAINLIINNEKIPLGIIFQEDRPTYQESLPQIKADTLINKKIDNIENVKKIIKNFI